MSTDPTLDFLGLFADQTEDVILARMIDWANEGLDPDVDGDQWVDTREGGHWRTAVVPVVREIARLYDLAGREVPMSSFSLWAWDTYLDALAASYDLVRLPAVASQGIVTFAGPAGTAISLGTAVGTLPASIDDSGQLFDVTMPGVIPNAGAGTGLLDLPVMAQQPGAAGDVATGAITQLSTPLPAGISVSNAAPTSGGADEESDEALRGRLLDKLVGQGGANQAAYVRWSRAFPGVGSVKVVPGWNGLTSVLVVIGDRDGQPLPASVVAGLQAELDPTPGQGSGTAPAGAQVTVVTPVLLAVSVAATGVSYAPGYSADGAGNTIAVRPLIADAIAAYLLTVAPGASVVHSRVLGLVATQDGIADVAGVTINGSAANLAVALAPPQVPSLSILTMA